MLKITVLGTGYVGLVSGVCLAETGHHVTCIDNNNKKIAALKARKIPIYEEGLEALTTKNIDLDRLKFSTNLIDTLNESDIIMIAVGTPIADESTGTVNLNYINECVSEIAKLLSKNIIVIVKSTVPVGTCDNIQKRLDKLSNFECVVISNPEFLREGTAVYDFMNPDRIVLGSDGREKKTVNQLYSKFIEEGTKIIYADRRTAELIKYASNAFLAMKVGFINEMADISEKVGADIKKLSEGIGSDKRIGSKFLNPGPGFGGSCFPKDVKALVKLVSETKINSNIIKSIIKANIERFEKISKDIMENVQECNTIAILGLTYKAGTDDIRDSPSIEIIKYLIKHGRYKIKTYDPVGTENCKKFLSDQVEYYVDLYKACTGASLVVIATEWDVCKKIDAVKLKNVMKDLNIYDLRGIIDKEHFLKNNFKIRSIGYKQNA
jgi:UDPglucose 6-dehydrogenase